MKDSQSITWQTVVTIIGTVLIASLLILFVFFYWVYLPSVKSPSPNSKKSGDVLGSSDSVASASPSSSPQLSATPTSSFPISSPYPSLVPSATPANSVSPTPLPSTDPPPSLTPSQSQTVIPFTDSFESGLSSWTTSGDVVLINQSENADIFTKPYAGKNMVRIGRPTNEGNPLSQNVLKGVIPKGTKTITFYYQLFSYDYEGFDSPAFTVSISNKVLFQQSADEIDLDDKQTTIEHLNNSGWKKQIISVPNDLGNNSTIEFKAGNDEQNLSYSQPHQSWVYVDSILFD